MEKLNLLLIIFALMILSTGCSMYQTPSSFTKKQKVEHTSLQTLKAAKEFRKFGLKCAGSFYKSGVMDEETKAEIIDIGDKLQESINTAADALKIYHGTGNVDEKELKKKLLAYQVIFNRFLEVVTPYILEKGKVI